MRITLRVWALMAGGAVVALLAGGWFLGAQPLLAAADTSNATSAALKSQNQTLQVKLASLARAAAKTDTLTAEAVVLDKAVPSTLKPNTFIRRINEVAAQDGVTVQSVAPGAPVAYSAPAAVQAQVAATAAAAAAAATPTSTPTPAATASAPIAPAAPSAPVLAKTDPLISGSNFTVVPVNVTVKGTPVAALQFVKDIQGDERTFLVSSYSTSGDGTDTSVVTAQLTGYIYTLAQ